MLPSEDVSDLRDVVDAINRLCETMKTSTYEDSEPYEEYFQSIDSVDTPKCSDTVESIRYQIVDPLQSVETLRCDTVDTFQCDPMETIQYSPVDSPQFVSVDSLRCEPVDTVRIDSADVHRYDYPVDSVQCSDPVHVPQYEVYNTELVSPEEVSVRKVEAYRAERWRDSQEDAETVTSDTEPAIAQFEPISEMYYTASSEVSLLSDLDIPDKVHTDDDNLADSSDKVERKECVIAGHVAAMRERFESMTRTNTPCPDLMRSMSPSLDVFRNITPSPDHLG